MTEAAAYWDARYRREGRVWGDGPSELARLAVARLDAAPLLPGVGPVLRALDAGCGYGRDARYLAAQLEASVLGVDPSPAAVAAALEASADEPDLEFTVADPVELVPAYAASFDLVFANAVYHQLRPGPRRAFAAAVVALTRPGGRLFLGTLSPRDPRHFGKGEPVDGEERSWVGRSYLHFCTREELLADFAGLDVLTLEERAYDEPHADGTLDHHVGWFLEGRRPEGGPAEEGFAKEGAEGPAEEGAEGPAEEGTT